MLDLADSDAGQLESLLQVSHATSSSSLPSTLSCFDDENVVEDLLSPVVQDSLWENPSTSTASPESFNERRPDLIGRNHAAACIARSSPTSNNSYALPSPIDSTREMQIHL